MRRVGKRRAYVRVELTHIHDIVYAYEVVASRATGSTISAIRITLRHPLLKGILIGRATVIRMGCTYTHRGSMSRTT